MAILVAALAMAGSAAWQAQSYDLVIANGQAMGPAMGLDSVRNVGIWSEAGADWSPR